MHRTGRTIFAILLVVSAVVVVSRWQARRADRGTPPRDPAEIDLREVPSAPQPAFVLAEPQPADPMDLADLAGAAESVRINEIHYQSRSADPHEEWIELFNRSRRPVSLAGWRLEGDVTFAFPPNLTLDSGAFLVVAASRNRLAPHIGDVPITGDWAGDLSDDGGTVTLRTADGAIAEEARWDDEPPYSVLAAGLGSSLERRSPHEPSSSPRNWGASDAAGWTRVVARGRVTSSTLYLYLGAPGEASVDGLSIRQGREVVFEDGFEKDSAPTAVRWSFAGNHGRSAPREGPAREGKQALVIVATGAGASRGSAAVASGLPVRVGEECEVELWARFGRAGLPLTVRFSRASEGSGDLWSTIRSRPHTPGGRNSLATDVLPPLIARAYHEPARPTPADTVTVSAEVLAAPPPERVTLHWEHAGRPSETALHDDGQSPDATANDGVYSAALGPFPAGALVLYRIESSGAGDSDDVVRYPETGAPTEKLGIFVERAAEQSSLRTIDLVLSEEVHGALLANRYSDAYHSAIAVHRGEVFTDVGVRFRGQTSRSYPKPNWKIKLNDDRRARLEPDALPVRTLNLNGVWSDKTFLRDLLAHDLFRALGEPHCEIEHVLLRLNGEPYGLYVRVENPGSTYLERHGKPLGWLWKAYSPADGPRGRYELEEGNPETGVPLLADFLTSINALRGVELDDYIRARIDVESLTSYLAACQIIHNADHIQKNYLIYADPEERFSFLPWDLDLTHGRNYECRGSGLLGDFLRHDLWDEEHDDDALLFGTRAHPKCDGWVNGVIDAFLRRSDAFRPGYYRRIAEALATYYHPEVLVPKIRTLADGIRGEVERDRTLWGTYRGEKEFDESIDALCDWVGRRYEHLREKLEGLGVPVVARR